VTALPSLADFATHLEVVRSVPHDKTTLEGQVAETALLIAYAQAKARAEGLDEQSAIVAAFHALRTAHGEDAAVDALARVGVDAYRVLSDVEEADRSDAEYDREGQ
jgi:hypothetical protein